MKLRGLIEGSGTHVIAGGRRCTATKILFMYSQKRILAASERGSGTHVIAGKEVHCNENRIFVFPEKKLRGLR